MLDLRDLAVPVVAAPMAGGATTPALVEAVGGAGALGFLAAGYKSTDALAAEIEVVAASGRPFGVNLFVIPPAEVDEDAVQAYADSLRPEAERTGVTLGEPRWEDDHWEAKLELVLRARPAVVSFTFGCPEPAVLARLADAGVLTMATVTTLAEAHEAVGRGVASLAVQGPDAGGHRGTWDQLAEPSATPLAELVTEVLAEVDVPVVAGGGVRDAGDVAALLDLGAAAAQVGTAFLRAEEAGTHPTHRAALADPASTGTTLTRAFTGRWARGLANRFTAEHADAPAGYPQLHHVTAPLRAAAARAGDPQSLHLWAGTGYRHAAAAPASEIVRSLTP